MTFNRSRQELYILDYGTNDRRTRTPEEVGVTFIGINIHDRTLRFWPFQLRGLWRGLSQ